MPGQLATVDISVCILLQLAHLLYLNCENVAFVLINYGKGSQRPVNVVAIPCALIEMDNL